MWKSCQHNILKNVNVYDFMILYDNLIDSTVYDYA